MVHLDSFNPIIIQMCYHGEWVSIPPISCQRGLRQGDPLSPMLFIILVDVLNKMILNNVSDGNLSMLPLPPAISNIRSLQFADDTIIFANAYHREIATLKAIFYIFESVSGLSINYAKTSLVYLGKLRNRGPRFASYLNCKLEKLPISYLGLPLRAGKLSRADWQPLVQKFKTKLSTWKGNSLSFGGRLTLINSVLSSLPIYFMSFYKLPEWLIKSIDKIRKNFLWGGSTDTKPIKCLVKWRLVCKSKKEGGLGVIDLKLLNNALLSKWLWQTLRKQSMVGSILYALYKRRAPTIQSSTQSQSNSLFWNNITLLKEPLLSSIKWEIGDGSMTRFWEDKWSGNNTLQSIFPHAYSLALSQEVPVSSQGFFRGGIWHWQPTLRRATMDIQIRDKQRLMIYLSTYCVSPQPDLRDSPTWTLSISGEFTVNSIYRFTNTGGILSPTYSLIWKSVYPSKVRVFLWLLSLNRLNTKANLSRKGWQGQMECVLCDREVEDSDHLFLNCVFSADIWNFMKVNFAHNGWPISMCELLNANGKFISDPNQRIIWQALFPIICWRIWHARNDKIFNKVTPCMHKIINSSAKFLTEWTGAAGGKSARSLKLALNSKKPPTILPSQTSGRAEEENRRRQSLEVQDSASQS